MPRRRRRANTDGEGLSENLSFRTTRSTKLKFIGAANAAGISRSELLDEFLQDHELQVHAEDGALSLQELRARGHELQLIKERTPMPSWQKEQLLYLFAKTSNNLNQLAHRINFDHLAGKLSHETYQRLLLSLENIGRRLEVSLKAVD